MLFLEGEGQGLVEYAFVIVLVSVAAVAIMALLGPQLGVLFSTVRNAFVDANQV